MRTFTVNGKVYSAKPFNFNLICDLEDKGMALEQIANHPMSFIRLYFGMCAGMNDAFAGTELENHIINGGSFDDIMSVVQEEMDESGFFQALNKGEEKTSPKSKTTKKAE